MTPERWRRIGELFDARGPDRPRRARGLAPRGLRRTTTLRAEVDRLLSQDERADRDGFLTPPEPATTPPRAATGELAPQPAAEPRVRRGRADRTRRRAGRGSRRLHPQGGDRLAGRDRTRSPSPSRGAGAAPRAADDLHPHPGDPDPLEAHRPRGQTTRLSTGSTRSVIAALAGIIALLSSRWPISLAWLKALELGMIGMLAGRVAFVQYRLMLEFSLRGDTMMAQLTMKNVVLLTAS